MNNRFEPNSQRWFSFYRDIDDLKKEFLDVKAKSRAQGITIENNFDESELNRKIQSVYNKTDELNEVINLFDEYKQKIDSGGAFKKTRIKISEDKRFTFSFALASKGLVRLPEYYNEQIAKRYPTMFNSVGQAATDETMVAGVVDLNLVQSKPLKDATYFYIVIDNIEYELRQQQKGTAKMLELNPMAILLKGDDGMYYTMPSFFGDFSLSFSSNFKKSYLEMPKEGGEGRAVDIYVPFDMIQGLSERMTPSIPLLLATQYFTQAKIKVRLNLMRPINIKMAKGGFTSTIVAFTIKDFQDPMDWNKIACLRGVYDAGQAITEINSAINNFKYNQYSTKAGFTINQNEKYAYASSTNRGVLLYNMPEELDKEFGRFKNFMRQEVEEGRLKTKLVPKPLMMVFSTQGLLGSDFSKSVIEDPTNTTNILIRENFNEILDMTDIYYNEKMGDVVKRVATRFESQNKSIQQLKNYLYKLVAKLYRDLEPRTGVYASKPEELEEADKNYRETIAKLEREFQKRGI